MIDHKNKFIFLHIPKTAGTSIGQHFYNEYYNGTSLNQSLHLDFGYLDKYTSYRIHFDNLNEEILKNYFVFTVVRNPYDRFISLYKFDKEIKSINFDDFCSNFKKKYENSFGKLEKIDETPKDMKFISDKIYKNINSISQTDYLRGTYTDYIDKFPYINKILKFENLENDFKEVCDILKISDKLPHLNKRKYDVEVSLSELNKNRIYEMFEEDFINFGYDK